MGWNALAGVILLAVALAAIVVLEGFSGSNDFESAPPQTRAESAATNLTPLAQNDRRGEWVSTTLARPLFSPDRRPPAAAGVPASVDIPRLSGILITPSGRSAIFAPAGAGKPVVATEGTALGPYIVKLIGPDEVTIVGPSGPRSLHPAFDPASAPVRHAPATMLVPPRLGPPANEASPAPESSQ